MIQDKPEEQSLVEYLSQLEQENKSLSTTLQHLHFVADSVPMLIAHVNEDMVYRYVNKLFANWHSQDRDKIIGKTVQEVLGEKAWLKVEAHIKNVMSGQKVEFESEFELADGGCRVLWVRYIPEFSASGEVQGFVTLVQDISEQRSAQKEHERLQQQLLQSQKMDALGYLVGGIAHDFNNILTSMLGFSDLAQKMAAADNSKLHEYLDQVITAGTRAKGLVSQMLAFGRGGPRKVEKLDLVSIVNDSMNLASTLLPSSITMEFTEPDIAYMIQANPVQFQQVILNLCINSRDAIKAQGKIKISVQPYQQDHEVCTSCHNEISGDFIELRLADTGSGIAPEIFDKIFLPFFTTRDVGKGTGMGLPVVHGIVHSMGGHVCVQSHSGAGTEVILILPTLSQDNKSQSLSGLPEHELVLAERKLKFMVLDDEPSLGNYLGELLRTYGHEVDVFSQPEEALEKFSASPDQYAVVVTDLGIPTMDGRKFSAELKKMRPDIKIILTSGDSEDIAKQTQCEDNVDACLSKPFSAETLIGKVNELIEND